MPPFIADTTNPYAFASSGDRAFERGEWQAGESVAAAVRQGYFPQVSPAYERAPARNLLPRRRREAALQARIADFEEELVGRLGTT